jgi:chitin disaccharide deacetylase
MRPAGRTTTFVSVSGLPTLVERLGHAPDARLVIVNADELGLCHAANVGVYDCLATGVVTSATLMVPGPWAREAAARYRGEDVGVHLTVNAEHERYRWGPITHAPSLLGGDGGFPATPADAWDHADVDEVRRELRSQVERAILWGFDVSHLDTHLGTVAMRPEFFDIYLELALEFSLPVRMGNAAEEHYLGFPARELAADAGVVFADRSVSSAPGVTASPLDQLAALQPGVTELRVRPAIDTAELRSFAEDWAERVGDHEVVCDGRLQRAIDEAGATLIGFRALRDLARATT